MNCKICTKLLPIAGLVFAVSATAHHSPALLYDLSKEIALEGMVTEYDLGNPHLRIYFDVDNNGTLEKWMAEVAPGDKIRVRGHPTRDGSKVVHLEFLTLADGTERYAEDLDRNGLEERRRRRE